MDYTEPTVAIFTFNTEAQIFCGDINNLNNKNCYSSDFIAEYINHIKLNNNNMLPDIFVVNLQESSIKNPFKKFKSNNLIKYFESYIKSINQNYVSIIKKMKGIGREGLRGLCTAVFVSKNISVKFSHDVYRPIFKSSLSIKEGQQYGKGAIMIELQIVKNSKIYKVQFINTHLPFSGNNNEKEIRDITLVETLSNFNTESNIEKFIIGDLNYRVYFDDPDLESKYVESIKNLKIMTCDEKKIFIENYKQYDQLTSTIRYIVPQFTEGINSNGLSFLPTCKMFKECPIVSNRSYQITSKKKYRLPSWCDRILHTDGIKCVLYESFDTGNTCKSDHKPVIGLFILSKYIFLQRRKKSVQSFDI